MNTTLDQYIEEVNLAVWDLAGVSVHDLPDADFYGSWQSEMPPEELAREILYDAGSLASE